MKKILFALTLLCLSQHDAHAMRRAAATTAKAIAATGIVGGSGYCATQSGCKYDHETQLPPATTRVVITVACCCPQISDDWPIIDQLKLGWLFKKSYSRGKVRIKRKCTKDEVDLLEGDLQQAGIKATRNNTHDLMAHVAWASYPKEKMVMEWEIEEWSGK